MAEFDRNRIGVPGSLVRRILDECEAVGLVLIEARYLDHLSRRVLVFDDETHLTEITVEDKEKPSRKKPKARSKPA